MFAPNFSAWSRARSASSAPEMPVQRVRGPLDAHARGRGPWGGRPAHRRGSRATLRCPQDDVAELRVLSHELVQPRRRRHEHLVLLTSDRRQKRGTAREQAQLAEETAGPVHRDGPLVGPSPVRVSTLPSTPRGSRTPRHPPGRGPDPVRSAGAHRTRPPSRSARDSAAETLRARPASRRARAAGERRSSCH